MKRIFLASILLPSVILAQSVVTPQPIRPPRIVTGTQVFPNPQSEVGALPDNYQLTLTIADRDSQPAEVSIVVASPSFQTNVSELSLSFGGGVTVEETGTIVVAYNLGWETSVNVGNSIQIKSTSTNGSVRLKPGEDIQIFRAGTRTVRLSIKKLEASK